MAEYCAIGGNITEAHLGAAGREGLLVLHLADPRGRRRPLRRHRRLGPDHLHQAVQASSAASVDTEQMMGNVFWDDPLVLKEVGKYLVGGTTVRDDRGRLGRARGRGLHRGPQGPPTATRSPAPGPSVFTYGYYTGRPALIKGARGRRRRRLRPEPSCRTRWRRRHALRRRGPVGRRQARRQPPGDLERLREEDRRGQRRATACRTCRRSRRIPDVDQTFGGVFTADTPGARPREPEVREAARRRRGSATPRPSSASAQVRRWPLAATSAEPPRRSSACGGSAGASAASSPCRDVDLDVAARRAARRSSARTGPARRRCST